MVARNIILAEFTRAPLHIAHVSTAGSVRLIREAKARGIHVTAETAPHYFTLTDEAVRHFDTAAKVNPPLRGSEDRAAIREGLRDGTIDVIASDHAPHARTDKEVEFKAAASGITGLETSLALSLGLVYEGILTLPELIAKMTVHPARILRIPKGTLSDGADADITVIDPAREWTVDRELLRSRGKNTPFHNRTLKGKTVLTIVGGRICYRDC
jgi:dihydroorotase